MTTKRTSSFRGKISKDGIKSDKPESYLNLPKGVELYNAEAEVRKVKLDFLPYIVSDSNHPCKDIEENIALEGNLWFRRPFKVHIWQDSSGKRVKWICPTSIGKKCPICEFQRKRFNEGASKEETIPLYPQRRSLYIVVPIDQKEFDEVPYVWDMADKMFQETLILELKDDPDNEVFPDLEEGKTLELRLKWKTIGEKGKPFPEVTNVTFLNRQPYDDKILDEVPDLDKVLKVFSYEELNNKFFELDVENTTGELHEVETEEPSERKRRSLREPKKESSVREERSSERRSLRREETTVEEKQPLRRERSSEGRRTSKEDVEKNLCPHGHRFGIDIDETNDCPECNKYDDCLDKNEKK